MTWISDLILVAMAANAAWQIEKAWQEYREEQQVADEGDALVTDLITDLELAKSVVHQVFPDSPEERLAALPVVLEEILSTVYVDDRNAPPHIVAEDNERPTHIWDSWTR